MVVNGYSGGANLPLLDQFHPDNPRHQGATPIRWITNSNESSSGHVTEGYSKAAPIRNGMLPVGVAIATSGPGTTNLVTPLQDAMCDGVPMVVLCGQAATTAKVESFQSAPAVAITTPCTKWSYQIKSAAELPLVMDYAFFVARNGRPGPVFIDLPKDLQMQSISKELIDSFIYNNLTDKTSEESFARLVTKSRDNGQGFHAVQFGLPDKGLAFEVVNKGNKKIVKAVTTNSDSSDIQHADHHPTNRIFSLKNDREGNVKNGDPMLAKMMNMIKAAKKPVIIAGQGCNDAPEELKAFAEALQIPLTTTLHALGTFDERHPLALNMMGMHGHPTPNFMVQESDLIICIGSRFDDRITGRPSDFIPEARKAAAENRGGVIHVDVRLSQKSLQVEPTYFVHSTGKHFLKTINAELKASPPEAILTGDWLQHMKELKKEYPVLIPKFPTEDIKVTSPEGETVTVKRTRMSVQKVVQELNAAILKSGKMDDSIFTTGVGIHQMVTAQLITWTQPRQMLSSGSLGTMGVALGYAVGAKLAQPGKMVIAIDGDGSFNMSFVELKTVAEQKIPVKIVIMDNECQMMVEYWQRLFFDKRYLAVTNTKNPDYCMLASSFGIKSIYADCVEDLPAKIDEFLHSDPDEPVLFHVRIERTPCLPLVAPGQPLGDMILTDEDFEVDPAETPS
jgi:acetolactate synthase-1/2/3 large subunit